MGYTNVVFAKNTLMIKSEKEKVFGEKLTWEYFLDEFLGVPLDSVTSFFYSCS